MTTFVLGAGASRHAGYPLASELWPRLTVWADNSQPEYKHTLETIVSLNGPVTDIEATLTDIDLGRGAFASLSEDERDKLTGRIRRAITAYFRYIRERNPEAKLYAALARHIATGDNIITFNYDIALERALIPENKFRVRGGYGFPVDWPEAESQHHVLKLHGSTNWAAFMPAGYGKIEPGESLRLCVNNEDKAFSEYPEELLDKGCGSGAVIGSVSLILPTHEKQFRVRTSTGDEFKRDYELLWLGAADRLQKCDRIVLIGYSMPKADRRARALGALERQ